MLLSTCSGIYKDFHDLQGFYCCFCWNASVGMNQAKQQACFPLRSFSISAALQLLHTHTHTDEWLRWEEAFGNCLVQPCHVATQKAGCAGHVQVGFEYLQERRFQSLWTACSVLCHPHSRIVFPHVQTKLPLFNFVLTDSYPATEHHERVWPHPHYTIP